MEVGGFRKNFPWTRGGARRKRAVKKLRQSLISKNLERSWEAQTGTGEEGSHDIGRCRPVCHVVEAHGSLRRGSGLRRASWRRAPRSWAAGLEGEWGAAWGTGSVGKVRGPLSWSAGAAVTEPAGGALTSHRGGFSRLCGRQSRCRSRSFAVA